MTNVMSDILLSVLGDISCPTLEAQDSTLHDQKFCQHWSSSAPPSLVWALWRPIILTWSCMSTVRSQKGPGSKSYKKDRNNGMKLTATCQALSAHKKALFFSVCVNCNKKSKNKISKLLCTVSQSNPSWRHLKGAWLMLMKKLFPTNRERSSSFLIKIDLCPLKNSPFPFTM